MNAVNANDVVIGSNFENYYNNLLQAQPMKTANQDTPIGWIAWFYEKFIENNILILCLLFCIGIYLYMRYQYNQAKLEEERERRLKIAKMKKKMPKQNIELQQIQEQMNRMKEYDEKLKMERAKLLKIIDEISSINDEKELEQLYDGVNGKNYNNEYPSQNMEADYMHNGIAGSPKGSFQLLSENPNVDNYIGGFYVDSPYR